LRLLANEWGIGVLLVEHDMDIVMSVCDEVVVAEFGAKIAQGTPDMVRSDPAVIAAYLGEPTADELPVERPMAIPNEQPIRERATGVVPLHTGSIGRGVTNGTRTAAAAGDGLLAAKNVVSGYGTVPVLRDFSLEVRPGEVVSLLGPNGAGKTTALLSLCGELPLTAGEVWWKGAPTVSPLHVRARDGLAYVTEERSVFMGLSTVNNLRVGGVDIDEAFSAFPELAPRARIRAGSLSGGEQQMLTLARALGRKPEILIIDELSLGLAPRIVSRMFDAVRRAADSGVAVLIVEQHVQKVLQITDRAYVLRRGQIEMHGTSAEIRARIGELENIYLASGGPA
jgi:ABC-type branched-subunit amino acid transport system ATPase component